MALKIIDRFDGNFALTEDARNTLFALLAGDRFLAQVRDEVGASEVEFTEKLFQPVPYSSATPKGMPPEFEAYHESEDYAIVNVPPTFMFQAKISQPPRLCAVYRKR